MDAEPPHAYQLERRKPLPPSDNIVTPTPQKCVDIPTQPTHEDIEPKPIPVELGQPNIADKPQPMISIPSPLKSPIKTRYGRLSKSNRDPNFVYN